LERRETRRERGHTDERDGLGHTGFHL
jgi:hypothetical protein